MYLQTRLGRPALRVIDLQLELAYYQKIGMTPIKKSLENGHEIIQLVMGIEDNLVSEVDNPPILTLIHDPEASRPNHKSAGLFILQFLLLTGKALPLHLYILRIKVLSSKGLPTT
jgi:catechol-2,3-dioxygenase